MVGRTQGLCEGMCGWVSGWVLGRMGWWVDLDG